MLLLPEHGQLEQILIGCHVVKAKVAAMVLTREKERDYKGVIEKLLLDPEFTEQAQKFARKYEDFDPESQIVKIAERCEELMHDL